MSFSGGPELMFDNTKLFGRDAEFKLLTDLLHSSRNSNTTLILHGAAGSGKSSLIHSQPWKEQGWLFGFGKYDPASTCEPYRALIEAMDQLVDQWVEHNNHAQVCQLSAFQNLLQEDFEVMQHILPKFYRTVAQTQSCQAAAQEEHLAAVAEAEQRRNPAFSASITIRQNKNTANCVKASFLRILACLSARNPLVIFLDDVHWADAASLGVLEVVSTSPDLKGVVLAISFRDEEVTGDHPLAKCVEKIIGKCECKQELVEYEPRESGDEQEDEENGKQEQENEYTTKKPVNRENDESTTAPDKEERTKANGFMPSVEKEEGAQENGLTPPTSDKHEDTNRTKETSASDITEENPSLPQKQKFQTEHTVDITVVTPDDRASGRPLRAKEGVPIIHDIPVRELDLESVNKMVASIVQRPDSETMPLAQVIHKKTAGNPFFVIQFTQMLRQEEFLRYTPLSFRWEWGDVEKLEKNAHVSSNVADMVARTMKKGLKESTLVALKVASCFGKIIPLNVLIEWFDLYYDKAQEGSTCYVGLRQIKLEGLYNVLEDAVKLGILIRPSYSSEGQGGSRAYMWSHDKLQSVAYSLIQEQHRPFMHMKLGKLLWKINQENPTEEWMVFMAADQMNRYSECRRETDEEFLGAEVAALCLEAAKLSLSKSALYPAYDMLQAGIKHMTKEDEWSKHNYHLSLRLYSTLAELAFQLGEREEASRAAHIVERYAKTLEDKFYGQIVRIKCATSGADRNYHLGVEMTSEVLKDYGVKFPSKLMPGQIMMECQKLRRRLPDGKLEGILKLPEMKESRPQKIMKLLYSLGGFINMSHHKNKDALGGFISVRGLNLSVDYGVCEESAAFMTWLGWGYREDGNLRDAEEYGEMGLKLMNRFPKQVGSLHASVMASLALGVYTATRPIHKNLDLLMEAHHVALRTGMTEKAGLCILGYVMTYFCVGLPIGPLRADLIQFEKEARQFNLPESVIVLFQMAQQFILNLEEKTKGVNHSVLKGKIMDQDKMLQSLQGNARKMTKRDIDTFRLVLACFYGEWESADNLISDLEPYLGHDMFVMRDGMRRAGLGLAAFKLSRDKGPLANRRLRSLGKKIIKGYREDLKDGNVNALPIYAMLEAEETRSKDRYDTAIRACARLGLLHFEAYMCEQAAYMFLEQKDEDWAEFYLAQAFALYGDWGATGKQDQLRQTYPSLLRSASLRERVNTALKGRTRYTSEHTNLLKDFDWERLSASTVSAGSNQSDESEELSETDHSSGSFRSRGRLFSFFDPE